MMIVQRLSNLIFIWLVVSLCAVLFACSEPPSLPTIKVGVLHSLSGTMEISERTVVDATLLAIEEINQKGGLFGRKIETIVVDGRSDWPVFAWEARRLIEKDGVSVVFGCWTSACRKTVKPIFEKHDHLLIYPVQYEGLESSPNIIYVGSAPNQQILPAIRWSFKNIGTRFFLVGSDYVFPHAANAIIKGQVKSLRGEIVGEEYVLLGSIEFEEVVKKIAKTKPDIILNTINGDSNIAFFRQLRAAGITSAVSPTLSFSISETELLSLSTQELEGDYAAWNYFQSIDTPENREFVARFRNRYGQDRVTTDPIEAAYIGVHLWAQAVTAAGTHDVKKVRQAIKNQRMRAPEGFVYVDADNNHTWKYARIGKIKKNGQFDVVWSSQRPIRPIPFPVYRTRQEWSEFLDELYLRWDGNWANPGDGSHESTVLE
jgi:urea ABC transporter urea binding protein